VTEPEHPAVRVADADRERVALALREHTVAGRLTLEEFSERVERAYAARTGDELEALTADLPGAGAGEPAARRREPTRSLTVIFGGGEKLGRWRIGRRFFCFTMLGGSDIDLRQAEIDAPEVAITAFTMWGGFDIYVPEGVEVDVTGFALFGGNSEHGSEREVHRDASLVRIKLITTSAARMSGTSRAKPRTCRSGSYPGCSSARRFAAGRLQGWKEASAFRSGATPKT
jgi:hypothetical protein